MKASNDHEAAIMRIIDRIADGPLSMASIRQVIEKLDFVMTKAESEFMVKYLRWRIDHPPQK